MPTVLHPDPFNAVLLSSPALMVTQEQSDVIREILETACSDSPFAEKAFIAIMKVLNAGPVKFPTVTSLNPSTAVLGSPSFIVHVMGTNFTPSSIIVFAGQEEPTTFVSDKEITTGVNMDVWLGPDAVPVSVLNADGIQSDPQMFTFTEAGVQQSAPIVTPMPTTKK